MATITTGEAARQKGVSRTAIVDAITRGDLKATRVGRFWLIAEKDLAAYVPARTAAERGRRGKGSPKRRATE